VAYADVADTIFVKPGAPCASLMTSRPA
jgi:hypothetical protein